MRITNKQIENAITWCKECIDSINNRLNLNTETETDSIFIKSAKAEIETLEVTIEALEEMRNNNDISSNSL